jgi:hypothetical protein
MKNGSLLEVDQFLIYFFQKNYFYAAFFKMSLKETVGFEKGELSKEAFIQLYKIEAQRDDTDVNDISSRLANMGFNKSLTIDQVKLIEEIDCLLK